MARPRKQTAVETAIQQILFSTAREIADAVRAELGDQLQRALAAGDGNGTRPPAAARSAAPPNGQRKSTQRSASTRTRAGAARLQELLLKALQGSKKGLGLSAVVKKVGADAGPVQYHLRKLRSQKKARVVGARQLARWFAQK